MPQIGLGFRLSPDNAHLTISTSEGDRQLACVIATATEVEKLIHTLAGFRRRMIPEVPRTLQDGQFQGELDPIWAIPTHPSAPDKVLTIRHFGMGWLSFFFPPNSARQLGDALLGRSTPQILSSPHRRTAPTDYSARARCQYPQVSGISAYETKTGD